jgi:pyrroline-5-carboxylate reductase
MKTKRLGFVGAGNMSGALVKGLLHAGVAADRISLSDVSEERLRDLGARHGVRVVGDNRALTQGCDVLVLAVKPQVIGAVLGEIGGDVRPTQTVISIAAGVPLRALEAYFPPGARVVRAMPNTPAMVQAGATAVAPGSHATDEDVRIARELFEAVGQVVTLDEAQLDAVTGLSGSGPAYVMVIIEALADGGVKMGLPRSTALLLAAQTVLGSASLLLQTGDHPGRLKDMVTSPGGTTIAGLHRLEAGAIRNALIDAVEAATQRSSELGRALASKLAK